MCRGAGWDVGRGQARVVTSSQCLCRCGGRCLGGGGTKRFRARLFVGGGRWSLCAKQQPGRNTRGTAWLYGRPPRVHPQPSCPHHVHPPRPLQPQLAEIHPVTGRSSSSIPLHSLANVSCASQPHDGKVVQSLEHEGHPGRWPPARCVHLQGTLRSQYAMPRFHRRGMGGATKREGGRKGEEVGTGRRKGEKDWQGAYRETITKPAGQKIKSAGSVRQ